jgi:hypothetical protein
MPSLPPLPKRYSAEIVRSDGDGSRIFTDGIRQRVEVYDASGIRSIVIARPDRGVAWSLKRGTTVFFETPFSLKVAQRVLDPTSLLDWEEEGTELIEGTECIRYRGRYKSSAGAAYELCFVEPASGIRRRSVTFDMTGAQKLTVNWHSVNLESPDLEIFEIPQGYSVENLKRSLTRRCT